MSAKDRKGSGDKRKNNGGALAGTLFTAAMICCCVLIYLLSRVYTLSRYCKLGTYG